MLLFCILCIHISFVVFVIAVDYRNNTTWQSPVECGPFSVLSSCCSATSTAVSVVVSGGAVNSKHFYCIHNDHSGLSSFTAYTNAQNLFMFCRFCWPLCLIRPQHDLVDAPPHANYVTYKFYSGLFWHLSNRTHWNLTVTFEDFLALKLWHFKHRT